MKKYAWKVLTDRMTSEHDSNMKWEVCQWKEAPGSLKICVNGFHASHKCIDAIQYVTPGIICKVEYDGKTIEEYDKFVAEKMRVVKTFCLTKKEWVELAIFCSELCIKNYEKKYPGDDRPRKALQAAKKWLKNPTKKNAAAALEAASEAKAAALAVIENKLQQILKKHKVKG